MPKLNLENLCKNAKIIRKNSNLTQKQFAEICNVSVSVIQRLENGKIPPRASLRIALGINKKFGYTVEKLLSPPENLISNDK